MRNVGICSIHVQQIESISVENAGAVKSC